MPRLERRQLAMPLHPPGPFRRPVKTLERRRLPAQPIRKTLEQLRRQGPRRPHPVLPPPHLVQLRQLRVRRLQRRERPRPILGLERPPTLKRSRINRHQRRRLPILRTRRTQRHRLRTNRHPIRKPRILRTRRRIHCRGRRAINANRSLSATSERPVGQSFDVNGIPANRPKTKIPVDDGCRRDRDTMPLSRMVRGSRAYISESPA